MPDPAQQPLPIQPVDRPILCSPYAEPAEHWVYGADGVPSRQPGRRDAFYWYKTERTGSSQASLFAEEERDDLPLVNKLRSDVRRWREGGYENATPVTKQLLRWWARDDLPRPLFFCQREAVETVIYLSEVLASGKKPRWTPELGVDDFRRLCEGERPQFIEEMMGGVIPALLDAPADPSLPALRRYGCKMATGAGKTVVMAMLIAWAFCNRARVPGDERFPAAALVCCPNLTIKERLQVLRPEREDNYYNAFDLVPSQLMPELRQGRVLVVNWHHFLPKSERASFDGAHRVVQKGEEGAEAFARKRLGDLFDLGPVMVLNDEAHHAYRPNSESEPSANERQSEWEEATIWVQGLDKINKACGAAFCIDLSATPFYLQGSGHIEGSPFPWLVSDFGLVDAIESGITKVPRLPAADNTGRPNPQFYALWQHVTEDLTSGQKLPGGRPKPDVVWRKAQPALVTLMSQWKDVFEQFKSATKNQERVPPVLIVVCDNTDFARHLYEKISGERVEEDEDGAERTVYGPSATGFDEFANGPDFRPTIRIDSKLLEKAESEDPSVSKADAAEQLRQIVATVGRTGEPGEQVRCVVSVQMLTEGWDANNVTHILGLRAFGSQLLCEQVAGRGLRRMDYVPDPETGLLTEEYVDIYGVPFSVIPFKGRKTGDPPPDPPKQHVRALDERADLEIDFPVVEGYAFSLKRHLIKADVGDMEPLVIDPSRTPTDVFVMPQMGYDRAGPSLAGNFTFENQNRRQYYATQHPQTIAFEIARQVTHALTDAAHSDEAKIRHTARHALFPQVFALAREYVAKKVTYRGNSHRCELGLEKYTRQVVNLLLDAIEPDDGAGEPPLLPILNRYKPVGSTAQVNFKTTRPCFATRASHVNQVVADTQTWEQSAAFRLEQAALAGTIHSYAKNDHLAFTIPYDIDGQSHSYVPDYLVRFSDGGTLILEIKGREDERTALKHQAAQRWVSAVNNWGKMGHWVFAVSRDPQLLKKALMQTERRSESNGRHVA